MAADSRRASTGAKSPVTYVDDFPHRSLGRQAGFYLFACAVSAGITAVVLREMPAEQDDGMPHFGPPSPHPLPDDYFVYRTECRSHLQCTSTTGHCCPDDNGLFASCCEAIPSSALVEPFYGMCYAAEPTSWMDNTPSLNNPRVKRQRGPDSDDYWSPWSRPFWGAPPNRDDLGRIAELGVKVVRLYGNDPRQDHTFFLDRAEELGLSVVVGMSDYIYTQAHQDGAVSCARNTTIGGGNEADDFVCRQAAMDQYRQLLASGLTRWGFNRTRVYHPAVKAILVINEPELKTCQQEPRDGNTEGQCKTDHETRIRASYTKVVISALHGMRLAEKEMDVVQDHNGHMPPFTVTWTFGACEHCKAQSQGRNALPNCNCDNMWCGRLANSPEFTCDVGAFPGMAMMYDFAIAMLRPHLVSYHADPETQDMLRDMLQNRFMLGFNSQNRMGDICEQLLSPLKLSVLKDIPLWQGEFKAHEVSTDVSANSEDTVDLFRDDLRAMRAYVDARESPQCNNAQNTRQLEGKQVHGFGIFEFQVPYYKGTFPEDQQCWYFNANGQRLPAHTGDWQFGIYSFGSRRNGTVSRAYWEETGNHDFEVWCLRDRLNVEGSSWAEAVADVLDGRHRDFDNCPPEVQEYDGLHSGGVWCESE